MPKRLIIAIRTLLVLLGLVGMPILAIPQVAAWCEARLYVRQPRKVIVPRSPVVAITPLPETTLTGGRDFPQSYPIRQAALREGEIASYGGEFIGLAQATVPIEDAPPVDLDSLVARVRALGATSYRLDCVSEEPLLYRFTAQFEEEAEIPRKWQIFAEAPEPAAAILQVIERGAISR